MLKQWIVTLHRKEDLDGFYDDMETPGGNLFIPDRAVELTNRRLISRNTHYMLDEDEVELIKSDDRVWDVELEELHGLLTEPAGWSVNNGQFAKDFNTDSADVNWGLLRHTETSNRSNWGNNGTSLVVDDVTVTSSGKNVDVVIVDGHVDPLHPEMAVNSDGTGGSRLMQFNWFSLTNAVTGLSNGTYVYDRSGSYSSATDWSDNDHGAHCAGTVAGNSQGWARDANVYNISPYGSNPNTLSSSFMWDYIRQWHNTKPINPVTGRRNPTITNNSYGSSIKTSNTDAGYVTSAPTRVSYRGADFNPARELTQAELQARGFYCPLSNLKMTIPYYTTSRQADQQDAIDDGIIIVAAAGNSSWKTVNAADQDYNNEYHMTYNGSNLILSSHRGTLSGAGYAPVINVGAASYDVNEDKANFSNCGSQVDIYAAGNYIQSSLNWDAFGTTKASTRSVDPRRTGSYIGKYSGTSMASPQVAGVLACLAESWPNMTQSEAQAWLINNASDGQMADTGTDDPMDRNSLQGGPNKLLRWINQREVKGSTFPQKNFRPRPNSGISYPRTRIRRRG
jgi:hypothetical protein|tara:strand:+ start:2507 stop:4201 length:1695 start_codon:yes stop_codon:yes gene_type:complete